jgi:RNA 3'-terminal phosphate cyclase (ATP)
MTDMLILDGSHGAAGGQILRTALSLSAITMRPFRLINIRAGRRNPGLLAQHLSAVRAAARISGAAVSGDQFGSTELTFNPSRSPCAGSYAIDVAEVAERGSAGAVTLILQTLITPLGLADGASELVIRGGTHVEWAPSFDDFANVYLRMLRAIGFIADAELRRWGWYPRGGGEVVCTIAGHPEHGKLQSAWSRPLNALERGLLGRISGHATVASLPTRIAQRMADRARAALIDLGVPVDIAPRRVSATGPGAGIFLLSEYQSVPASFSAYGWLGKPAEAIADEAAAALREHHASTAAVEVHLADQLLLPLSVAGAPSVFTTPRSTPHLATNAWVIGEFGIADIVVEEGEIRRVRVEPLAAHEKT